MISAGELRTGSTFERDGELYTVLGYAHVKQGRGTAFVRAKFRNVNTGSVTEETFRPEEKFGRARIERSLESVGGLLGQRCRIHAEAYPERHYEGYVSRLMPTADRAKSAIPVRVKVSIPREEEGVYLKPDMGAIVTFFNRKIDRKLVKAEHQKSW